jgi:hypothetical protein
MDFIAFREQEQAIFAVQYALLAISEQPTASATRQKFCVRASLGPTSAASAITFAMVTITLTCALFGIPRKSVCHRSRWRAFGLGAEMKPNQPET